MPAAATFKSNASDQTNWRAHRRHHPRRFIRHRHAERTQRRRRGSLVLVAGTRRVDFQSSMNVIRAAEEAFNAMPAEVRDRFQNDPGRFLEFANDASNYEEALKMGLAIKRPKKAAVGPENGLPEPSVDLGAVRPGGADRSSSQA